MTQNIKYFIITGDPGIGKTTIIQKICSLLNSSGVKTVGFFTEEVRRNRMREGFDVISLTGERGRLARDQNILTAPTKYSVGKYGVLVQEFENIALPALKECDDKSLLVIDEIGKMELFSSSFKLRIKEFFSTESKNIVLATIPSRKGDPIIESIRNNNKTKIWMITREKRNIIHEKIFNDVKSVIHI
uniref:Nucleoside-triphosphatase C1orf57-like protein n=1 Tax=Heliconius erato TaxID=33431 RepID=L7X3V9_HELEA|nr:nucleoside-triphosphatase C1orf57-like protein [Heliconius erato]